MSTIRGAATGDLLSGARRPGRGAEALAEGAMLLAGFAAPDAAELMKALAPILALAPFRHMVTPGGHRMSVAMTNCGDTGWVTDRRGYRYDAVDPMTKRPWPPMPASFRAVAIRAAAAAGFTVFEPDSCLINGYEPAARLSLHQDKNERHFTAPIVSQSPPILPSAPADKAKSPSPTRRPILRWRLGASQLNLESYLIQINAKK